MEMRMNSTSDYVDLIFRYYYLGWVDLTKALFVWMDAAKTFFTDYQACYNVAQFKHIHLYGFILSVKVLILSHGMVSILPRWVSVTLFPTLMAYYHFFLNTGTGVACKYSMWHFAFVWTLLWQFPYHNTDGVYMACVSGIIAAIFILEAFYVGFQFAIDVFIALTTVWFVVKSFVNGRFNITFITAACAIFYFNQGRGPQIPEVFYMFLFLMLMGLYGGYVTSRGQTDEMLFYFSTVIGITFLMCYNITAYGFTGIVYSGAGKEVPFKQLPVYEPEILVDVKEDSEDPWENYIYPDAAVKSFVPVEDSSINEGFFNEASDAIDAPRPRIARKFPRTTTTTPRPDEPVSEVVVKPEVESIILTPDVYGMPNLSAGMLVKYRTNESVPTMLY